MISIMVGHFDHKHSFNHLSLCLFICCVSFTSRLPKVLCKLNLVQEISVLRSPENKVSFSSVDATNASIKLERGKKWREVVDHFNETFFVKVFSKVENTKRLKCQSTKLHHFANYFFNLGQQKDLNAKRHHFNPGSNLLFAQTD